MSAPTILLVEDNSDDKARTLRALRRTSDEDQDIHRADEYHANSFVRKPVAFEAFSRWSSSRATGCT